MAPPLASSGAPLSFHGMLSSGPTLGRLAGNHEDSDLRRLRFSPLRSTAPQAEHRHGRGLLLVVMKSTTRSVPVFTTGPKARRPDPPMRRDCSAETDRADLDGADPRP